MCFAGRYDPFDSGNRISIIWIEHVVHALLAVVGQADSYRFRPRDCKRRTQGDYGKQTSSGNFIWESKSTGRWKAMADPLLTLTPAGCPL